jgi:hypothetical protein
MESGGGGLYKDTSLNGWNRYLKNTSHMPVVLIKKNFTYGWGMAEPQDMTENVAIQWLAILLHVREVPCSNLSLTIGCHE